MLGQGQIEDRDSKKLLAEMDEKIYAITIQTIPDVPLESQKDAILHSVLGRIFSKEEIETALKEEVLEEISYEPGCKVINKNEKTVLGKKLLFVTRGIMVESVNEADELNLPRRRRADFANLQNLLPDRLPEGDSLNYENDSLTVDVEVSKMVSAAQLI